MLASIYFENHTSENILTAIIPFINLPIPNEGYCAWQVVSPPLGGLPLTANCYGKMEIVCNYHCDENAEDPYSGQQSKPVWVPNNNNYTSVFSAALYRDLRSVNQTKK